MGVMVFLHEVPLPITDDTREESRQSKEKENI